MRFSISGRVWMSSGTVAMKGEMPSSSSRFDDGGAMEARFAEICKGLALDESLTSQAMKLLKDIRLSILANMSSVGRGSPEEIGRILFAFLLYCVTKLGKSNQEEGSMIKLFQIFRTAKLNTGDFFKEMPQCSLKAAIFSAASIVLIGRGNLRWCRSDKSSQQVLQASIRTVLFGE